MNTKEFKHLVITNDENGVKNGEFYSAFPCGTVFIDLPRIYKGFTAGLSNCGHDYPHLVLFGTQYLLDANRTLSPRAMHKKKQ